MRELNENEIEEIVSIKKEKRKDFISSIYDASEVDDILAFINVSEMLREWTRPLKEALFDKYCEKTLSSSNINTNEDDGIEISNLIKTVEEIEEEIEVC